MTKAAAREVKYIIALQLLQPFMHTCIEFVMFKKNMHYISTRHIRSNLCIVSIVYNVFYILLFMYKICILESINASTLLNKSFFLTLKVL